MNKHTKTSWLKNDKMRRDVVELARACAAELLCTARPMTIAVRQQQGLRLRALAALLCDHARLHASGSCQQCDATPGERATLERARATYAYVERPN